MNFKKLPDESIRFLNLLFTKDLLIWINKELDISTDESFVDENKTYGMNLSDEYLSNQTQDLDQTIDVESQHSRNEIDHLQKDKIIDLVLSCIGEEFLHDKTKSFGDGETNECNNNSEAYIKNFREEIVYYVDKCIEGSDIDEQELLYDKTPLLDIIGFNLNNFNEYDDLKKNWSSTRGRKENIQEFRDVEYPSNDTETCGGDQKSMYQMTVEVELSDNDKYDKFNQEIFNENDFSTSLKSYKTCKQNSSVDFSTQYQDVQAKRISTKYYSIGRNLVWSPIVFPNNKHRIKTKPTDDLIFKKQRSRNNVSVDSIMTEDYSTAKSGFKMVPSVNNNFNVSYSESMLSGKTKSLLKHFDLLESLMMFENYKIDSKFEGMKKNEKDDRLTNLNHIHEKVELRDRFVQNSFLQWKVILLNGFSILLHGFGSKYSILQKFSEYALRDGYVCIIRGYKKNLRFYNVFLYLLKKCYSVPIPNSLPESGVLQKLVEAIENHEESLYLVVHNIDSVFIQKYIHTLSLLASLPKVRLIASSDAFQYNLIVDPSDNKNFNFWFEKCSTFIDYREELSDLCDSQKGSSNSVLKLPLNVYLNLNPIWTREISNETLATKRKQCNIEIVLKSLTTNHKRLFRLVAEKQYMNPQTGGMFKNEIMSDVQASAIAPSYQKLKLLLKELYDHQILCERKLQDGRTFIYIPHDGSVIENLLAEN